MMQTLRKYMKHIIWIVAVAFILTIVFSWGMGGFKRRGSEAERGIIGIINGQKIQYRQFLQAYQQEIENAKKQSDLEELPEYRRQSIRDQVWQTIVRDVLLAHEIRRLKIQASDEEIVFHIRNNPPDFILTHEQFQTDGKFDVSKYHQALSDPGNYDAWIPLENYFRNTLPIQKLQQQVIATVRVTNSEVRETYRLENERVSAKYILFNPNDVPQENIEVIDSEIQAHYKEHKEDYWEPEKRKIQYVLFEGKPSKEDSTQTYYDIQDLLDQIREGADFEELAKEYSEDTGTASKGGDLGFFGRETMVKPFEKAAFSAKVGEVVGPVKTQFGLHIIQILSRKIENGETKVHARHILLKYKTSPQTYDARHEWAQYFYDEVVRTNGEVFSELAEQEKLSVRETPLFQKGGFIPGIGMASHISHYAFKEKIGWVSQPMTADKNIIVFRISDVQKSHVKPLEEVKESIRRIIHRKKRKNRAGEICQRVWEKINDGTTFESVAQEDSLQITETGFFSLLSSAYGVGRDARFSGATFRLDVGEVSRPVEGERGYYLIKVIDRVGLDEKKFEAEKERKKQALLQQKRQLAYMAWFNHLKERADIKDYRNLYF